VKQQILQDWLAERAGVMLSLQLAVYTCDVAVVARVSARVMAGA